MCYVRIGTCSNALGFMVRLWFYGFRAQSAGGSTFSGPLAHDSVFAALRGGARF